MRLEVDSALDAQRRALTVAIERQPAAEVLVPIRLPSTANVRQHHHARAETARRQRMAAKLGVQLPSTQNTNTPSPAPAPAPVDDTTTFRPNTLSDLVSGAPPTQGDGFSEKADGMAMAQRFGAMSDSQMAAVIRRSTGG